MPMSLPKSLLLLCAFAALQCQPHAHAVTSRLPDYQPGSQVSGRLSSAGSDTLAGLMALWTQAFRSAHPAVIVQMQAAGSSTAPTALVEATANLGPMSRPMKASEIRSFRNRYGYDPTAVSVALDALVLYVHRENPLQHLTLPQVDAIFSANRRCGAVEPVKRWGQLGLEGAWNNRAIQVFGRNSASGTYGFFKTQALCRGDYHTRLNEQSGAASVVQAISVTRDAIGYSGVGFRTAAVKPLGLAEAQGEPVVYPEDKHLIDDSYPLTRHLYIYLNKPPGQPLRALEREFLRLVFSRQGQEAVQRDGYIPLPPGLIAEQIRREALW